MAKASRHAELVANEFTSRHSAGAQSAAEWNGNFSGPCNYTAYILWVTNVMIDLIKSIYHHDPLCIYIRLLWLPRFWPLLLFLLICQLEVLRSVPHLSHATVCRVPASSPCRRHRLASPTQLYPGPTESTFPAAAGGGDVCVVQVVTKGCGNPCRSN